MQETAADMCLLHAPLPWTFSYRHLQSLNPVEVIHLTILAMTRTLITAENVHAKYKKQLFMMQARNTDVNWENRNLSYLTPQIRDEGLLNVARFVRLCRMEIEKPGAKKRQACELEMEVCHDNRASDGSIKKEPVRVPD